MSRYLTSTREFVGAIKFVTRELAIRTEEDEGATMPAASGRPGTLRALRQEAVETARRYSPPKTRRMNPQPEDAVWGRSRRGVGDQTLQLAWLQRQCAPAEEVSRLQPRQVTRPRRPHTETVMPAIPKPLRRGPNSAPRWGARPPLGKARTEKGHLDLGSVKRQTEVHHHLASAVPPSCKRGVGLQASSY